MVYAKTEKFGVGPGGLALGPQGRGSFNLCLEWMAFLLDSTIVLLQASRRYVIAKEGRNSGSGLLGPWGGAMGLQYLKYSTSTIKLLPSIPSTPFKRIILVFI